MASKPQRNDPCTCGSGKKYKKCCGAKIASERLKRAQLLPKSGFLSQSGRSATSLAGSILKSIGTNEGIPRAIKQISVKQSNKEVESNTQNLL